MSSSTPVQRASRAQPSVEFGYVSLIEQEIESEKLSAGTRLTEVISTFGRLGLGIGFGYEEQVRNGLIKIPEIFSRGASSLFSRSAACDAGDENTASPDARTALGAAAGPSISSDIHNGSTRAATASTSPASFLGMHGSRLSPNRIVDIFVRKEGWLRQSQIRELLHLAHALPGLTMVQLCTSVAAVHSGLLGALLSAMLLIVPGAVLSAFVGALLSSVLVFPLENNKLFRGGPSYTGALGHLAFSDENLRRTSPISMVAQEQASREHTLLLGPHVNDHYLVVQPTNADQYQFHQTASTNNTNPPSTGAGFFGEVSPSSTTVANCSSTVANAMALFLIHAGGNLFNGTIAKGENQTTSAKPTPSGVYLAAKANSTGADVQVQKPVVGMVPSNLEDFPKEIPSTTGDLGHLRQHNDKTSSSPVGSASEGEMIVKNEELPIRGEQHIRGAAERGAATRSSGDSSRGRDEEEHHEDDPSGDYYFSVAAHGSFVCFTGIALEKATKLTLAFSRDRQQKIAWVLGFVAILLVSEQIYILRFLAVPFVLSIVFFTDFLAWLESRIGWREGYTGADGASSEASRYSDQGRVARSSMFGEASSSRRGQQQSRTQGSPLLMHEDSDDAGYISLYRDQGGAPPTLISVQRGAESSDDSQSAGLLDADRDYLVSYKEETGYVLFGFFIVLFASSWLLSLTTDLADCGSYLRSGVVLFASGEWIETLPILLCERAVPKHIFLLGLVTSRLLPSASSRLLAVNAAAFARSYVQYKAKNNLLSAVVKGLVGAWCVALPGLLLMWAALPFWSQSRELLKTRERKIANLHGCVAGFVAGSATSLMLQAIEREDNVNRQLKTAVIVLLGGCRYYIASVKERSILLAGGLFWLIWNIICHF
ncbi:unnamed protein product [Amoebophrya sp. A25]|nr:unnamed protein product [Amoebophrya sp. A25]|eukprot:GSA25T00019673001.1